MIGLQLIMIEILINNLDVQLTQTYLYVAFFLILSMTKAFLGGQLKWHNLTSYTFCGDFDMSIH